MSTSTISYPRTIQVGGHTRWESGSESRYIGNLKAAAEEAKRMRQEKTGATVRRYGCIIAVYRPHLNRNGNQEAGL